MNQPEQKSQGRMLAFTLIPFLLVLLIFGFLGFCSFPSSDDFIMAQDLSKGFFWAIQYWLGYWLSSWTTAAAELSIPLAFGYYDYGLAFFAFVSSSLFLACLFLFRTLLGNVVLALSSSFLFFTLYLNFVPSVSEVLFWNIGALAYTIPFAGFLFFIGLHEKTRNNVLKTEPGVERIFISILGLISVTGLLYIWKVIRVSRFIPMLDKIFPPDYVYAYWSILFLLLAGLYVSARRFHYVNHLLIAVFSFLVVGLSPQSAIFLLAYAGLYLAIELYQRRKVSLYNIFVFLTVAFSFFIMMKMPGTAGRMSLTNPHLQKNFDFYFSVNIYLLKTHFVNQFLGLGYLLTFFAGMLLGVVFKSVGFQKSREIPLFFLLSVVCLHALSLLLIHFSNGHFPLRLSCNFIALNFMLFYAAGLTLALPSGLQKFFREKAEPMALLVLVCLLFLAPNLGQALGEIQSGEAIRFRHYKLAQYETIQNCASDTCTVPYQAFRLKSIPNQDFIFPGEKGFVLSHKYFVSRYFKKEVIRYDPLTLPPDYLPASRK
jgi:hypothetical protein